MPAKPIGTGSSLWTGDNGVTYNQSDVNAPGGSGSVTNDLSGFSSLGPTADGRIKPEIVAPGEPIIAAKASGVAIPSSLTVGSDHFKEAGTSMSSPHAAGIVALLLQRNNTLGVDQVRTALAAGAHVDGMTAKTPDPANSYGAGKVDATAVLGSVSIDTSAYHGTGDLESPESSSGCSLAARAAPVGGIAIGLALIIASIALVRRRMRVRA
jgi:subtilisin family serine protease